jgi:hypothetical protein
VSQVNSLVVIVFLLVATAVANSAKSASEVHDLDGIVAAMERTELENGQHAKAYTVTREYRLYGGDEAQPMSEVVASVSFVPPNEKTFTIEKFTGSDRAEKIVQHVLQNEADTTRRTAPALSRERYDFSLAGEDVVDGSPCWVLNLQPKRSEKDLINGKVWVDKRTHQIRRVDGDLTKTPSWWLKRVHLTVEFGDAEGMWMQKNSRAVAEVRMFGRHVFTGEAVKVQTAEESARADVPPRPKGAASNAKATTSGPTEDARAQANLRRKQAQHRTKRSAPPVFGAGVLAPK